jgi:VanZ like family/Concanavalin A-like lectin/glucanases superfamily
MNFSGFRRVGEKKLLASLCLLILGAMLVAAFWPFRVHPKNRVNWLGNEHGLRFAGAGIVLSSKKFELPDSGTLAGVSLEIWLKPSQEEYSTALLAVSSSANPEQFRLRQDGDALLVLEEPFASSRHSAVTALWVLHAFQAHQRSFIAISSGALGTTVYVDGVPTKKSSTFRVTDRDFSGQLIVGSAPDAYDTWRGEFLGMAVFGRELTQAQVSEHYQVWLHGRPELLKNDQPAALFVFAEGAGNIVRDQIPAGSDLVIPPSFRIPFKPFLKAPWREFHFNRSYLRDVFINVSGFVPFGFFFCMYFSWGQASRKTVLATILLGAAFSLTIEVLQWYIPMRDSGTTDILTNTLGTALGAMLYRSGALHALFDRLESRTTA